MGIKNFIKSQFIEVIEWTDSSMDTIVYRFPVVNKEIKMGAMLTVRESQVAIFVNQGQLADVYTPGLYELSTNNMPIMCKINAWKYGFNSPFKAEVYFVNTKQFLDQKWGTQSPVPVMDSHFGQIEIRARGTYSFRVSEPTALMREVFGTKDILRTDEITAQLRSYIIQHMKDTVAESKMSFFDLQGNLIEFSDLVKGNIAEKLTPLGLEMINLVIEDFSMPDELMQAYREGSKYNLVGGYDRYVQNEKLKALNTAAANEGGGMAGLGATIGAGAIFGNMMGQNANSNNSTVEQNVLCPHCRAGNNINAKFCSSCGKTIGVENTTCVGCKAEIPKDSRFCSKCGASQITEKNCSKCGTKLPADSKFCNSCGTQIKSPHY
jgi:membrane protease subunit (stomatin/prohibitin family)